MVASIITLSLTRNQLYVLEPPLQEEKVLTWKLHVLIPFIISRITHVFSGPFLDINTNVAKPSEIFPCYHRTKTLEDMTKPLYFNYMATRVFCSVPYVS